MNKQQTAVKWLQEQMALTHSPDVIKWLFAKAIEMEKKQIEEAARWEPFLGNYAKEVGEEYYNDNYKSKDNE